jgi:hypothetical protein
MRQLLLLAAVLVFSSTRADAQETRRQKQEQSPQRSQYREQAQGTQEDQHQKESQSYAGKISEKHGKLFLEQEFHRATFELQGTGQAKQFLGKRVRVTGVLDAEHNILRVIAITKTP